VEMQSVSGADEESKCGDGAEAVESEGEGRKKTAKKEWVEVKDQASFVRS